MAVKEPRVVAELGRPETPEEAASRKAQNSVNYRESKTVRNLLVALGVSLLLVLAIALFVVRFDPGTVGTVNWHSVAQQAGTTYADPALPSGWTANAAEFRDDDGAQFWYIGFLTPSGAFLGFEQHATADPQLLEHHLDVTTLSAPTTITAGGIPWSTFTSPGAPQGNYATVWESTKTKDAFLLYGTATAAEFQALATAIQGWTR
jgi:hypothetical protein